MSDFAGANYGPTTDFSVAQQYYDRSGPGATKRFVPYALSNGGYVTATDPFPASGCSDTPPGGSAPKVCRNDAQLRAEIQKVVVANKWRQDGNTEYLLFTPNGVGSCFTSGSSSCAYSGYCAYHSSLITGPGSEIVYANMPWAYTMPGCDAQMTMHLGYSNGSAIDPEVGVLSHEIIETMTDVNGKAWFDSSGGEIGDKCAYNYDGVHYGAPSGLPNNGLGIWNQIAGGNEYLMQTEFSNHNSNGSSTGCVGKNTDTAHQPIVTISIAPSPPVHGSSALFKANVTHSNAVSTVQWSFGDGSTSSVNQVSHTYATAGTKVLNVIVTDMSGNQKSVTESITVH